ncbi:CusA/CzcA family heavy metal efflux RND transporter [Prolixibacteraceae bacterium Z1-6]|uniref:CusA/CzcA family heavy metal efflux RND transporter n=1 Tax=Draconibacterium aestuarii TaxID=2998507 RepID=A0A9X3J920_9BACT|nr:CusA/CzcA family heavy metal efflux RND transporter [Prolixibacteraceae bacterium Z1-6]
MKNFVSTIIGFSLKNRLFVLLMTGVLIAAGIISYTNTPIEAFPDVTNSKVRIISQWQGRSAEEIEKFVSLPIEVELNSVPGKTNIRSISLFGLSVVTVSFGDDMDEFKARQLVMNGMANLDLPEDVDVEMEPSSGPTGEIFRYILRSNTKSVRELKTIQDWVVDRQLRSVSGVADIVSFGGEVKVYEIAANPVLMRKYDITALELFEAMENSNINVGGDIIRKNDQAFVVRGLGWLENIDEIENVIIDNIDGTPILVKDVADVHETFAPRLGIVGLDDQPDLVQGIVVMRKNENPGEVIDRLKVKIDDLNTRVLEDDVQIETFYDREELINFTTKTVLTNLAEGIFFVVIFVLLFMANWRTTLMVVIVIPLSLLFAFVMMRAKGMSANLLSLGAIDFGIIVNGAVVMIEGIFVMLDKQAKKLGMERFNKLAKMGLIKRKGSELGKSLFASQLITILALVPIFAFQEVEGKMFSPLAYTFGFALLGALILSLTLIPVLASILLRVNVQDKDNRFVRFVQKSTYNTFLLAFRNKTQTIIMAGLMLVASIVGVAKMGSEFLPQLNEGALYVRAMMPMSSSLEQSYELTQKIRKDLRSFPEVKSVLSQTGRPNDGTDPTGFFNIEFHVELHPHNTWERKITKDELVEEMDDLLTQYQGIGFNFSQPIMDNVEEAVSGVKGALALKIYGNDLEELEDYALQSFKILNGIEGVTDLAIVQLMGQPEIRIKLDEQKMALHGVTTADANSVIEMAIGGKVATELYEGERKFDVRIRYQEDYRKDENDIGDIMVPTLNNTHVALKEIATISTTTGPAFIHRSDGERNIAVTFSVRGRDLGSTIKEAQQKFNEQVQLGQGMHEEWAGEFENLERAQKRLAQVVPIVFLLIFLVLYATFSNMRDAGIVILNVPFALIGGIFGLHLMGINFSISAGVGFIALFGICVQNGVILISKFKQNLQEKMKLDDAIKDGVKERIRPVLMTASTDFVGLIPAMMATGIGSESQKPLATVIVWGVISGTILTLFVFPIMFRFFYRNR